MSLPNDPPSADDGGRDDLQFDVVEPTQTIATPAARAPAACAACGRPIGSTYYAVGTKPICEACAAQIDAKPTGPRSKRLGLATLYGIGAAILGAMIWYVIRRVTHLEIGYVAILVGFMVGSAVRKGSGNRGGRAYQLLALILTYASIAGNYAPDVITAVVDGYHERHATVATNQPTDSGVSMSSPAKKDASAAGKDVSKDVGGNSNATDALPPSLGKTIIALALLTAIVVGLSLAAPFLGGFQNVIGLLIIAFALFQAWKMNRARRLPVTGPYQVGQPRAGAVV